MWIDMLNAVKSVLTDVSSVSPSSEHIWYLISVYGIYGEPITAPGRFPYSFQEVCEFFNVPYIGLVKVERLGQQLNIPHPRTEGAEIYFLPFNVQCFSQGQIISSSNNTFNSSDDIWVSFEELWQIFTTTFNNILWFKRGMENITKAFNSQGIHIFSCVVFLHPSSNKDKLCAFDLVLVAMV